MKLVDKFTWFGKSRKRMENMLLMALILFTVTAVEAGTFKIDLEGCRAGAANGYHLEQIPGQGGLDVPMYICNDAAYTDGNLFTWAELDMVPHRLTFENTTGAAVDFNFTVGGDYIDTNDPTLIGWDYITELVLDVNASDVACQDLVNVVVQALDIDGANLHRHVTVVGFPDDTTCVVDYNMRLAIGSSGYSGSSLQDYLLEGSGMQTLPLPAVSATTFSKTMTAVQGGSRNWTVTKSSETGSVLFPDTCADSAVLEQDVNITVSWTKGEVTPAGNVNVTTVIKASNTASRDINISVVDTLYSGTTELDTTTCGPTILTSNTVDQTVCINTYTIPEANAIDLNDKAIATYIDPDYPASAFPDAAIDQTQEATASAVVQGSGINTDENATIKDHEWISGTDFNYSVDSFTPDNGTFDNGYTAGVETHGDVNWTSDIQTGDGYVSFTKTVYAAHATQSAGSLSDTASLVGSDGFVVNDGPFTINLSSSALVELTIVKTIDTLIVEDNVALDFNFTVRNEVGFNQTFTIPFEAADATSSKSITITGLDPALYEVKEVAIPGYEPMGSTTQVVDLNLPTCEASVTFDNTVADRPVVKVAKITDPAFIGGVDQAADWNMTLYKETEPGVWQTVHSVLTAAGGVFEVIEDNLTKGSYKIEEIQKSGWYTAGVSEDCTFTYDPADGNRSDYECIFFNKKYSTIIINKVTEPNSGGPFSFTQDINASMGDFNLSDGDNQTYQNLTDGTYNVTENDPTPGFDLTALVCEEYYDTEVPAIENTVTNILSREVTINLDPGETVACTFTNTERGKISVLKLENGDVPTQVWTFTLEGPEGITEQNTSINPFDFNDARLIPGATYALCEIGVPVGWDANWTFNGSIVVPHTHLVEGRVDRCYDFTVSAAQVVEFVIDNISPFLSINIEKYTNGIDADTGTGPLIPFGSTVNWTYIVTNYSEVNLTGITVTDNMEGQIICPDTNLTAGASMTCYASGMAIIGQYANIGTVTATPPTGGDINDSDPSHYFGEITPSIDIEKYTNGIDADTGTGPEVDIDSIVTWTYDIRNTGDVDLTDINVIDTMEGQIGCPSTTLAVGASMTCTATGNAVEGQYENTATVTALAPDESEVTDSDLSHYFGGICDCDNISSDSSPAMNKTVGVLMILMTVLIGLFFVRREEQYNRNKR